MLLLPHKKVVRYILPFLGGTKYHCALDIPFPTSCCQLELKSFSEITRISVKVKYVVGVTCSGHGNYGDGKIYPHDVNDGKSKKGKNSKCMSCSPPF